MGEVAERVLSQLEAEISQRDSEIERLERQIGELVAKSIPLSSRTSGTVRAPGRVGVDGRDHRAPDGSKRLSVRECSRGR
jgi:hypothetical protein